MMKPKSSSLREVLAEEAPVPKEAATADARSDNNEEDHEVASDEEFEITDWS